MSNDIQVKGLSDLNAFLQQLPAKMEANVLRGALRAGAKVVQEEVVRNVPVDSGELKAGIKVSTSSKRGTVTARIRATGKHAFLAYWLEFTGAAAHVIHAKTKAGFLLFGGKFAHAVNNPGFKARPFMRPALQAQATAAVLASANYIKTRLATKHGLDTSDVDIEVP